MRKFLLIISIINICTINVLSSQNVKITGLGASKCGKYIDDVDLTETSEKIYFAWAQGFMNGALVRAPAGVDDDLDLIPPSFPIDKQMSFLRTWCKFNSDGDFSDAAFALFKELRAQIPK